MSAARAVAAAADDGAAGGELAVLERFWNQVHLDLTRGHTATRRWLDSEHFEGWVRLSFQSPEITPAVVRAHLLRSWRAPGDGQPGRAGGMGRAPGAG